MKFSTYTEVDRFVMLQREEFSNGKEVDIEGLKAAKIWMKTNKRDAGEALVRVVDSILRGTGLDERSLPRHPLFELIRSFELSNRSMVRSKNMTTEIMTRGDVSSFAEAAREVPEIKKAIDMNDLAFTAYLRLPVPSREGIFIFSLDVGLDSSRRPSRFERFLFQIPPDVAASEIHAFILQLINVVSPVPVPTTLSSANKGAHVYQSIQDGLVLKHADFELFMQDLLSALSVYDELPSNSWFSKPAHVVFNPVITPTPHSNQPSEIQNLINIGGHLGYDFSKHMTFRDARQTLTVLQWFASNPTTNGLEALVVEAKNLRTTNPVMSQILSSPQHYDADKISIMGHLAALGVHKNLSFPDVFSDWDFFQHGQNHPPRDVLFCILREQLPNSCGTVAFAHFETFIPIETNEIFAVVRELKCWDKSARQKLKDIYERLNREAICSELKSSKDKLFEELTNLQHEFSELVHFFGKMSELEQKFTESNLLLEEMKSEITNDKNERDQLHEGLKQLRNPDQLAPFLRQRYQPVIADYSPPSKWKRWPRKEGTQNQLERSSKLRFALLDHITKDQEEISKNLRNCKERMNKKDAEVNAIKKDMADMSEDFEAKAGHKPELSKQQKLRDLILQKTNELAKINKKLQRLGS
jgi:hypothetical protein